MTKTRKFGGKVYSQAGMYPTKSEAEKRVRKLRAGGRNARVVKEVTDKKFPLWRSTVYNVYWRMSDRMVKR